VTEGLPEQPESHRVGGSSGGGLRQDVDAVLLLPHKALESARLPLDPPSAEAISQLRGLGLRPVLLTGDNEVTARAVAREVGIDVSPETVIANVLPADKVDVVKRLQSEGRVVAMVGDGVNDAQASRRPTSGCPWAPAPTSRSRPAT
jgi:phosphoserine phosphatase